MKKIILLGSTGSIGTQCLDIVRKNRDRFSVSVLCCGTNIALLRQQIQEFTPQVVVVAREEDACQLQKDFPQCTVLFGEQGIVDCVQAEGHVVLNALVGMRGLLPTLAAIKAGKDMALANKETLVAGGDLVMAEVARKGVQMLPVDSEHSAIFQCLEGALGNVPKKLILTASGGPFRGYSRQDLEKVTLKDALKHPNWSMGQKITIDSATMVNKGLEIIEAHHLFQMPENKIDVVVHPQSIVHSLIEFEDGAQIAQLGVPDMHLPIAYALTRPQRWPAQEAPLSLAQVGTLTFEEADDQVFCGLAAARESLRRGGTCPAALNGANEELVAAFLRQEISFLSIGDILCQVVEAYQEQPVTSVEAVLEADQRARRMVQEVLKNRC